MSKEGWRAMLFKEHASFVAGDERSAEAPVIDAMAMDAFDTGYDFMKQHNDNSNALRANAFTQDAVEALQSMFQAGMLAFIKDKEAS